LEIYKQEIAFNSDDSIFFAAIYYSSSVAKRSREVIIKNSSRLALEARSNNKGANYCLYSGFVLDYRRKASSHNKRAI